MRRSPSRTAPPSPLTPTADGEASDRGAEHAGQGPRRPAWAGEDGGGAVVGGWDEPGVRVTHWATTDSHGTRPPLRRR